MTLKINIMKTIKNLDTVTLTGLVVVSTIILPLIGMILTKVLTTSNIIF